MNINKSDINNKMYTLYYDKEKQQYAVVTHGELVDTIKKMFFAVLKSCNIDNELRAEHKPNDLTKKTLFEKYLDIHKGVDDRSIDTVAFEMLESMYIETLRTLDIDNKLSDSKKYEPKKYNDPKMTLYEKIELKKLIEPNLWNRFDDFSRLALEQYSYDTPGFEYAAYWYNYQQKFIDFFIEHYMFYWGDGIGLPSELNPITPYLIDRSIKDK